MQKKISLSPDLVGMFKLQVESLTELKAILAELTAPPPAPEPEEPPPEVPEGEEPPPPPPAPEPDFLVRKHNT